MEEESAVLFIFYILCIVFTSFCFSFSTLVNKVTSTFDELQMGFKCDDIVAKIGNKKSHHILQKRTRSYY